ncbi:MAG: response regulator [Myxococcales bacterium]|nr:response regulator [Myxococcales bacterium]
MARVLVVEDSSAMRAFVRAALEDWAEEGVEPIEVVEAASGFDALRLLPRGTFDCVVTDVNMPDINGLELVNFMRKSEHHKGTPLLIISTQSAERDRERGLALGADAWLAKPFEADELRATVRGLLSRGRDGSPPTGPTTG